MTLAELPGFPSSRQDRALLYCKGMVLFVLQGVILLSLHAMRGFDSGPDGMSPALETDWHCSFRHVHIWRGGVITIILESAGIRSPAVFGCIGMAALIRLPGIGLYLLLPGCSSAGFLTFQL